MKLSVENGTVVCSFDNRNSEFLNDSAGWGLFDGFLNGKLKMNWDKPKEWQDPDEVTERNASRLTKILLIARRHGVEVDESVEEFNGKLQSITNDIKARRRALREEHEQREKWEMLCRNGCGRCRNLAYDIDLPICKQTGEILEEKNVQKYIGGVLHLFNLEPFPSENCPFNINKKQGVNNERLSETCISKAKA